MKKEMIKSFQRNKPGLLTGFGVGTSFIAVIFAIDATPKAIKRIELKEKEEARSLSLFEKIKASAVCYIPTAFAWGLSALCVFTGLNISNKRIAALATTCYLSENAMKEYSGKVINALGKKKENEIRDELDKDALDRHPKTKSEIFVTGTGNSLCYDSISGRYFYANIEKLRRIENDANSRLLREDSIMLNDIYYMIGGLPPIGIGDTIGWNVSKGLIEMRFSSQLADDGTPCLVMGFVDPPYYEF